MAENNKSYRIRTKVGREADSFLDVHLEQDYDSLEILSLTLKDKDTYKLHNSDYGVVVGRVLANGNFGVPNAKISVFIPTTEQNSNLEMWNLYPYSTTSTKNNDDIRYNLLPDASVEDCHKPVGTFPHKTYLLENDALLEVFDKYYIYTTRTNAAGDYIICGVPTGMQTLHMDLDLSDCGILSQRPRDFVYKGYTIEQFENPNQFKQDENIDGLSQIFSQDQPVYVQPFWGNEDNGEQIGITRADIEIAFKFEPTCVFMGSAISDNNSNGIGKKCVPTNQMGAMEELTAGEGTIEMIRKTPGGNVEEFSIRGNQLIDGNGVWCYQIPMNLDYMMTDEYGNMVPTDDPEKGIPTRTRVRFRASLTDMENNTNSYYRAKYLIPNNPSFEDDKVDYNFGTYTDESSYRDLFWNGVYTIKSYIPRFQKSKRWKSERFSGIKGCNYYGNNNPMPYNNMRIKLPFMFTVLCVFVKLFIKIVTLVNRFQAALLHIRGANWIKKKGIHCVFIGDGLCPDMEGWFFAPSCAKGLTNDNKKNTLFRNTLQAAMAKGEIDVGPDDSDIEETGKNVKIDSTEFVDETSIDYQNIAENEEDTVCLTMDVDYLLNCFEMNLAQEYRVINFDFYNDWVNGVLFFPRWMRKIKRKKKYKFTLRNGLKSYYKDKIKGCMNSDTSMVKKSRYYTQQCSIGYYNENENEPWTTVATPIGCQESIKYIGNLKTHPSKCHKKPGMAQSSIFGKKSGLVTEATTMLGQYVYYLKPCEWKDTNNGKKKTLLFATDIVLLGTLNDCDENGLPQAFKYLGNTSYIMPTNLALTTMDDDAYIYAGDKGTVCSSSKTSRSGGGGGGTYYGHRDDGSAYMNNKTDETATGIQTSVKRITPSYESTYSAYSKTEFDQVDYGDYDDPVPVTESAGITWNYSGPGQDDVKLGEVETPDSLLDRLYKAGNKRYDYLYYPGGHFLGLSCVNSDSNIKSCVNLKRICEMGATMSQRREDIYNYDEDGKPQYRYFVPTGLISNVDIEGASFRSMFATLNHNKLIATRVNENTGYKMYDFRFLRPDGFDGSLANYVHQKGSPYNSMVKEEYLEDATSFFERIFQNKWFRSDDYDPNEIKNTARRTIEDTISDYYMFRFGVNDFSTAEQEKHYLNVSNVRDRSGNLKKAYSLPQYENSFYFYFGLKDGATALDEFKKQFYSECGSNRIMRTPSVTLQEMVDICSLNTRKGSVKVIIDNMVPEYTYVVKNNATGEESDPKSTEQDEFVIDDLLLSTEYTITITDSTDQTISKTITLGSSVFQIEYDATNFRTYAPYSNTASTREEAGSTIPPEAKYGGYIKIKDNVKVFGKEYSIFPDGNRPTDNEHVSFAFRYKNQYQYSVFHVGHEFIDISGEKWYIYYMPYVGDYEVRLAYLEDTACTDGSVTTGDPTYYTVQVFDVTLLDNKDVNLFVSCDYLAYKPEPNPDGGFYPCCSGDSGLSVFTENDWYNNGPFQGTNWENWLMRHSYYRQTQDDSASYDNHIYTKGIADIAIFGQPECGSTIQNAGLLGDWGGNGQSYYKNDYDKYLGYVIDEAYTFITTMFITQDGREEGNIPSRKSFDAMSYTDDGRAAANTLDVTITGYSYDAERNEITLSYTGDTPELVLGHGSVVVFENGSTLFPIVSGNSTLVAYGDDIYPTRPTESGEAMENFKKILGMTTVYPTLRVPSMYKPFYAHISAATWNVQYLTLTSDGTGASKLERVNYPRSYKVEGDIYNGLTYDNHFYSGDTTERYDTYFIFDDKAAFYTGLTNSEWTSKDYESKYDHVFGKGEWNESFGREVTAFTGDSRDFDEFVYQIVEGMPSIPENVSGKVYTERYDGSDFGLWSITDSCTLPDKFYNDLKIKVFDTSTGVEGQCSLYSTEKPEPLPLVYRLGGNIFNKIDLLTANTGSEIVCCGYYNGNAQYDEKGAITTVIKDGETYKFSITNESGVKMTKTTNGIESLKSSGITLFNWYTLSGSVKNNISNLSLGNPIVVGTDEYAGDPFFGGSTNAIVAAYSAMNEYKNAITVYKFYPFGSLDVIYPASPIGIDPYLFAEDIATDYYGKTLVIPISTNVNFRVEKSGLYDWITLPEITSYFATATSISIDVDENPSTTVRHGYIKLICTEEGVDVLDRLIKITQSGISSVDINVQNQIDELKDRPSLIIDPTYAPATSESGQLTINYTATNVNSVDMFINTAATWVHYNGQTDVSFSIWYDENDSTSNRMTDIVISGTGTDGSSVVAYCRLIQDGIAPQQTINKDVKLITTNIGGGVEGLVSMEISTEITRNKIIRFTGSSEFNDSVEMEYNVDGTTTITINIISFACEYDVTYDVSAIFGSKSSGDDPLNIRPGGSGILRITGVTSEDFRTAEGLIIYISPNEGGEGDEGGGEGND